MLKGTSPNPVPKTDLFISSLKSIGTEVRISLKLLTDVSHAEHALKDSLSISFSTPTVGEVSPLEKSVKKYACPEGSLLTKASNFCLHKLVIKKRSSTTTKTFFLIRSKRTMNWSITLMLSSGIQSTMFLLEGKDP